MSGPVWGWKEITLLRGGDWSRGWGWAIVFCVWQLWYSNMKFFSSISSSSALSVEVFHLQVPCLSSIGLTMAVLFSVLLSFAVWAHGGLWSLLVLCSPSFLELLTSLSSHLYFTGKWKQLYSLSRILFTNCSMIPLILKVLDLAKFIWKTRWRSCQALQLQPFISLEQSSLQ